MQTQTHIHTCCCCCQVASVVSDSVRPHRRQPTRLLCPWDSPGKNTGVGCHFFLQCMKVKSESEVALSCPTLSKPMDCSLPGSSVHGIFQTRVLEWGAIVGLKPIYITDPVFGDTDPLCSCFSCGLVPEVFSPSFPLLSASSLSSCDL